MPVDDNAELITQRKQNCYLHLNLGYRFNAVDTCGMLILSPFYPVESGAPPFNGLRRFIFKETYYKRFNLFCQAFFVKFCR